MKLETAQDLLTALLEVKEKWGTLDVPINVFHSEDRHGITMLDLFTDNQIKNERLHSIDINLVD
jgi:hypothetical protein